MSDIELVIKIPKEMYEQIINENGIDTMLIPYKGIIKNGTPLPKGHGRLIDADDIDVIELEDSLHFIHHDKGDDVDVYIDAPTIIEADKEQTDGKV